MHRFIILSFLISSFLFLFSPLNILALDVFLNEILPNPQTGEKEWIEFYNNSSSEYPALGWILEEKQGEGLSKTKEHALGDFTIPKKGYWTFDFSSPIFNNSGDIITIKDNQGNVIDTYSYSNSESNKSYGRVPDGGGWSLNLTPSKAASNGTSLPSPSPSSLPSNSPPSSSTPSPSSFPTPTPSSSSNFFSITSSQTELDSLTVLSVKVDLTNEPNSNFYFKGAFQKEGSTNYFGQTKVGENWIKNNANYSLQKQITTDPLGKWSGDLEVKIDTEDSGYTGSGGYLFKVARYNSVGTSLTWSNILNIQIKSSATQTQNSPTPKSSTTSVLGEKIEKEESSKNKVSGERSNKPTTIVSLKGPELATIAGISTENKAKIETKVASQKSINWLLIIGGFLILILSGVFVFINYRKKINI